MKYILHIHISYVVPKSNYSSTIEFKYQKSLTQYIINMGWKYMETIRVKTKVGSYLYDQTSDSIILPNGRRLENIGIM